MNSPDIYKTTRFEQNYRNLPMMTANKVDKTINQFVSPMKPIQYMTQKKIGRPDLAFEIKPMNYNELDEEEEMQNLQNFQDKDEKSFHMSCNEDVEQELNGSVLCISVDDQLNSPIGRGKA